jgi:hypothetical protein
MDSCSSSAQMCTPTNSFMSSKGWFLWASRKYWIWTYNSQQGKQNFLRAEVSRWPLMTVINYLKSEINK